MGRQRQGWTREKAGLLYVGFTLRSGRPYEQRVPAPENGAPLDKRYLDLVRLQLVRKYESGAWDPEAPAPVPTVAPADPVFIELLRRFAEAQTYESAPKDQKRVAFYLSDCPTANLRVRALESAHGQALIAHLAARPSKRGGRLSPSSVRNVFDVCVRALDGAVEDKLLASNPFRSRMCRRVLPAKERKNPAAAKGWLFAHGEVVLLLADVRVPLDRRVLHALLFLTGMRVGELAVLRFSDWDRTTAPLRKITIAVARKSVSLVEGSTKSGAVKVVPVHPTLQAVLTSWWESGWESLMGRAPTADDYIVPSVRGPKKGQPRNGSAADRRFHKDCKILGLRERHLYCTRHTFITLTQDDGGDGTVLRWITHAPPRTSYDRYLRQNWVRLCAEMVKLRVVLPGVTRPTLEGSVVVPSGEGQDETLDDSMDGVAPDPSVEDPAPSADDAVLRRGGRCPPDLKPVPAVGRLEVVDLLARHTEDATHRRGHVLVQSIGEFDDDHGPTAGRSHEAANHRASRLRTKLAEHDLHNAKLAWRRRRPHGRRCQISGAQVLPWWSQLPRVRCLRYLSLSPLQTPTR